MMGRRVERGNQNVARGRFWRRGGASEYSGVASGAVGRMDVASSAISTSLYWAPLFARLHKRREPKTGGLIFRGRARQEGMWRDEEISAIEILGSLSSLGVSRR